MRPQDSTRLVLQDSCESTGIEKACVTEKADDEWTDSASMKQLGRWVEVSSGQGEGESRADLLPRFRRWIGSSFQPPPLVLLDTCLRRCSSGPLRLRMLTWGGAYCTLLASAQRAGAWPRNLCGYQQRMNAQPFYHRRNLLALEVWPPSPV